MGRYCSFILNCKSKNKPPLQGLEHVVHDSHDDQSSFSGDETDLAGVAHGGRAIQTFSSWSYPTQTLPPKAGEGLVQVRLRVFIARPQVWEQADQEDHDVHPPWTVQLVTFTFGPSQVVPPCFGGGLLQSLIWHWQPSAFCDLHGNF